MSLLLTSNKSRAKAATVLSQVRELISHHSRWTKGAEARNPLGDNIGANDYGACRWCLAGAIFKVDGDNSCVFELLDDYISSESGHELEDPDIHECATFNFNDSKKTKHKDVLQMVTNAEKWFRENSVS